MAQRVRRQTVLRVGGLGALPMKHNDSGIIMQLALMVFEHGSGDDMNTWITKRVEDPFRFSTSTGATGEDVRGSTLARPAGRSG